MVCPITQGDHKEHLLQYLELHELVACGLSFYINYGRPVVSYDRPMAALRSTAGHYIFAL